MMTIHNNISADLSRLARPPVAELVLGSAHLLTLYFWPRRRNLWVTATGADSRYFSGKNGRRHPAVREHADNYLIGRAPTRARLSQELRRTNSASLTIEHAGD